MFGKLALVMLLTLLGMSGRAWAEGRDNSALLNGAWEFAVGQGDEKELGAGLTWAPVTLPGQFVGYSKENERVKCVWARRSFVVSPAQAGSLAVLRWNHVDFGATAFINGREVGSNEPTGPYQVMVPAGVLRAGENEIVLKVLGGSAVRTCASGKYMLIPAGFQTRNPVGAPAVRDDVWLDFAAGAYMRSVLALPDLKHSQVAFRVVPEGLAAQEGVRVQAEVRSWPDGKLVGRGEAEATVVTDPDPLAPKFCRVEVSMPHFKAWTPEERNLYTATLRLAQGGRLLDKAQVRFGMREIGTADGRFKLNGKDLWLRGSDLVGEWTWPGTWLPGHEKEYLVDESRVMNMNSFRTHTLPQPASWSDIGDENGIMFLTEFRLLFNGANPKFTPEEYAIFHRNCLLDAAGWIDYLGNHPSVVMWVLSNESYSDPEWESGPYRDFVRSLDPSRPTMRSDQATAEIQDEHPCGNTEDTDGEGSLDRLHPEMAGRRQGPRSHEHGVHESFRPAGDAVDGDY